MSVYNLIASDMLGQLSPERARQFLATNRCIWHQCFELAPGVTTPGASNVAFLMDQGNVPASLHGLSVLDVGTSNGGCAFEAERRGASRVVAVDIYPPDRFGFSDLKRLCDSKVEFLQATVYELPERLNEQFDLVFFFGVLYHLRHPLLALDRLRDVTKRQVLIETAVCDHESAVVRDGAYVRFYRRRELAGDPSNWFAPSIFALTEWISSCGFEVTASIGWPSAAAERAMVSAVRLPDPAEYRAISYEAPIVSVRTLPVV